MKATRKQREAVAKAIDVLALFAMVDTQGAIRELMEAFPGVESDTDDTTRETLIAVGVLEGELTQ